MVAIGVCAVYCLVQCMQGGDAAINKDFLFDALLRLDCSELMPNACPGSINSIYGENFDLKI